MTTTVFNAGTAQSENLKGNFNQERFGETIDGAV